METKALYQVQQWAIPAADRQETDAAILLQDIRRKLILLDQRTRNGTSIPLESARKAYEDLHDAIMGAARAVR